MGRKKLRRDWADAQAKISASPACRGCGRTREQLKAAGLRVEAAHLIGRGYDPPSPAAQFDRYVPPAGVVPLCGPQTDSGTCHHAYDGAMLNLWDELTEEEAGWVVGRIGEGRARRAIEGRQPLYDEADIA